MDRSLIFVLAFCCSLLRGDAPGATLATLRLDITDAANGHMMPGLVKFTFADGRRAPVEGAINRGAGLPDNLPIGDWWALLPSQVIRVPRAPLRIEVTAGLDYESASATVDLTSRRDGRVRLELRRFVDPGQRGFRSGNTHIHLRDFSRDVADRYLREIPRGDHLDITFLSYLERVDDDKTYISNSYTKDDLAEFTSEGRFYVFSEEHRHNFSGYGQGFGHVMFVDLKDLVMPVSIGPGIMKRGTDSIPLRRGIQNALGQGATVIWCHNEYGMEDLPNWIMQRIQAQNIFDGSINSGYDATFYRYLNVGWKVPFSTGTDWFIYDFSRVYVQVEGELTVAKWLDGLKAGRSYITNGPQLEFSVDGRAIGDTLRLERGGVLEVVGRAAGRHDFKTLELIHNGVVIERAESRAVDQHFEAAIRTRVEVKTPSWLALRTPPPPTTRPQPGQPRVTGRNEFGRALYSHSSPIYIEVGGRRIFRRDVALGMLEEMREHIDVIQRQGVFLGAADRDDVLSVYHEAIAKLRDRLGRAGDERAE